MICGVNIDFKVLDNMKEISADEYYGCRNESDDDWDDEWGIEYWDEDDFDDANLNNDWK